MTPTIDIQMQPQRIGVIRSSAGLAHVESQQTNKEELYELALFAGAGGGILGGKLLGWRTVCAVEWAKPQREILMQRQNEGHLHPFPIWDDVQTFDGRPWAGLVDVVSGGFPCQDISSAGKGAGIEGDKSSMWKHMARVIGEIRPKYALVENSPMLTVRGLGVVLGDLAALGYNAAWGVFSAGDVGARHERERIWIVADSTGRLLLNGELRKRYADSRGRPEVWEEPAVSVLGASDGLADRLDSQRCIGNGQVPAVVVHAWQILAGMESPVTKWANDQAIRPA